MCRRSSIYFLTLLVSAFLAVFLPRAASADEVAAYLLRHGLNRLLAVHLEQQLETATGEQREDAIRQLADLYAELIESESDPLQRQKLEHRGSELVSSLPKHDAGALRLALLLGSYRTLEKIAENHRLRLSNELELEKARRDLDELLPRFHQLRLQLQDNLRNIERRLSRASGMESARLFSDVELARGQYEQCIFYNAWALYYQSWLHQRPDNAKVAQLLFAELLDGENLHPDPREVSIDLRGVESFARSILGMALCKSLTASAVTAESWVDLIDHEATYEPLRREATVWRMVVLLEQGEFTAVSDELQNYLETGQKMPSSWLRLIAVHALEAGARDRKAQELIRYTITELASREELDQVFDLANRYGMESLGESGFALKYIKGVQSYSEARADHDSERPAHDSAMVARFKAAAEELQLALSEPDARKYPDAVAACRRLIGYSRFFEGKFLEARRAFELAASLLQHADDSSEALWMAIVCLDRVVQVSRNATFQLELEALMDRFLQEHPSSEYAPKIILKRAMGKENVSESAVENLLEIPANSEEYERARIRAAQMLYQLFRKSKGQLKIKYAVDYIAVMMPVQTRAMTRGDATLISREQELLTRCRILLEISLSPGVMRLTVANKAFQWLEQLEAGGVDLAKHQSEITFRRVLERLYADDELSAASHADAVWDPDELSIWSRLASRAIFKHAHRTWQGRDDKDEVTLQTLELIARYGGRILREYAGESTSLREASVLNYHAAVAEASLLVWERTRRENSGRVALTIYEKLLKNQSANAKFLRATALLSEEFHKPEQALKCWRILLAGTAIRSEVWFEAKYHQISLLAREEPDRARAVLAQHKLLNPDYGPDPWGPLLKGLDVRLSSSDDPESQTDEEGDG